MTESTTQGEVIWGFYEEEYPIYTNQGDAHPELGTPMTVDQANGLVKAIRKLTAERDALRAACNQARLAFAGYVSVQSAINMLDALGPKEPDPWKLPPSTIPSP